MKTSDARITSIGKGKKFKSNRTPKLSESDSFEIVVRFEKGDWVGTSVGLKFWFAFRWLALSGFNNAHMVGATLTSVKLNYLTDCTACEVSNFTHVAAGPAADLQLVLHLKLATSKS